VADTDDGMTDYKDMIYSLLLKILCLIVVVVRSQIGCVTGLVWKDFVRIQSVNLSLRNWVLTHLSKLKCNDELVYCFVRHVVRVLMQGCMPMHMRSVLVRRDLFVRKISVPHFFKMVAY